MTIRIFPFIALATTLVITLGCESHLDDSTDSDVKTDLGAEGNQQVVDRFALYKQGGNRCAAGGNGTRVLLTGFGRFQSAGFNISGTVAEAMGNPSFWPNDVPSIAEAVPPEDFAIGYGNSAAVIGNGASVYNRSLRIEGKDYEVCVLVLDVLWDLAASIILYEADAFQPAFVMMSGRGGEAAVANLEGGAVNAATNYNGFDANGAPASTNRPVESGTVVLPKESFPVEETAVDPWNSGQIYSTPMTWNSPALSSAMTAVVKIDGLTIKAQPAARPDNNYICNNVSYVILNAAKGREIILAGGGIRMRATLDAATPIGFFHYPYDAERTTSQAFEWAKGIAAAIKSQLGG